MSTNPNMPAVTGASSLRVIPTISPESSEAEANIVNPDAGILPGDYITLNFPLINLSFTLQTLQDTTLKSLIAERLLQFREHNSRAATYPGRSIIGILATHYLNQNGYTEIPTQVLLDRIIEGIQNREIIVNYVRKPVLEA